MKNPHLFLIAALGVTAAIYLSSRSANAKTLNAGLVELRFLAPVHPPMLRAIFSEVTQLDQEGKVFRVRVPEYGEFNLPGLVSATPV